jgi:hypothetical protein
MLIPEYDPDAWSLIYFREYDPLTELPQKRFPSSPSEVIHFKTPLVVARLCNGVVDTAEWPTYTPEMLGVTLAAAEEHPFITDVGTIYSIHPQNVLGRILHWSKLRHGALGDALAPQRMLNLVDLFHGPAVLTLSDRLNFSTALIQEWTGIETEEPDKETATLLQLCRKLRE